MNNEKYLDIQPLSLLSQEILDAIFRVKKEMAGALWLSGGWVRDYLLGRSPADIDMVTDVSAHEFCRRLVRVLGKGTIVPLGTEDEEACRVVVDSDVLDLSSFRGGATSIEDDLRLRDLSINAMACAFTVDSISASIIDPCGGRLDLREGVLRACPDSFVNDPLRILRVYRFKALLGFCIDDATRKEMIQSVGLLQNVAAERKAYELSSIVCSPRGAEVVEAMRVDGVLVTLLPELVATFGVNQPAAHHLDVWGHSLAALASAYSLLHTSDEDALLPRLTEKEKVWLLWAALLHDIGKPVCAGKHPDDGRPTFYNHDRVGATMVQNLSERLRWSNDTEKNVSRLIDLHMRAFHLCNSQNSHELSIKAALKFYRKTEGLLLPLFYLSLADSLASQGKGKPVDMEEQLLALYTRVQEIYNSRIEPMESGPRLITGHDVMKICGCGPGRKIKEILSKVEELQVQGCLKSRGDAVLWLKNISSSLSK